MKQYLELLDHIMKNGCDKGDRTGTGTKSVFGTQMRFNLQEGFPLVTTKKVHFKSIVHELIWILSGNTNIKYLQDNKVKIWDAWADENGDLGPVYGHQFRRWEKYTVHEFEGHEFYVKEEIDQIQNAIDLIKNDPMSRRIIVNAWNPSDLDKMALTPCHAFLQFNCRPLSLHERHDFNINDKTVPSVHSRSLTMEQLERELDKYNTPKYFLDSHLLIRSNDIFLGCAFNIASYALLTHMIAQITNTVVGDLVYTGGDSHIYDDHVDQVKLQLTREPYPLPEIKLNQRITNIDDFKYEDIELVGYQSHPRIKAPVAV
jgi:thymidylate synthase